MNDGDKKMKLEKAADTLKEKGRETTFRIQHAVEPIYKKPAVKKLNNKKARIYLRTMLYTMGVGAMLGIVDSSKLVKYSVQTLKQETVKPDAQKDKINIMLMIAIGLLVIANIAGIASASVELHLHRLNMEDIEDKLRHAGDGAYALDKDSYIYKLLSDMGLISAGAWNSDFERRCVTMFGLIETYMTDVEYKFLMNFIERKWDSIYESSKQSERKAHADDMIDGLKEILMPVIKRNGLAAVLNEIAWGADFPPLDFNQEAAKYNLNRNNER